MDVQQPVCGATADPQCPTRVNHCHQLGTCLELFPQKHRVWGLEETPTQQDALGWGEKFPSTLILNQTLTLIQTLTQTLITTLILPFP